MDDKEFYTEFSERQKREKKNSKECIREHVKQ